jgi:triacylglycerol lipase
MSNILINSSTEKKEIEKLLNKSLPNYRQAYSDRTSWLMACISELAYVRFNPIFKSTTKEYLIGKVSELVDDNKMKSLKGLIEIVGYDAETEKKKLKKNVEFLNLNLVKTFDNNGTQAIFLENDKYIFLGFRGTEATSIKDIKSDAYAVTKVCETGGKIHSGFNNAFNQVHLEISETLSDDKYKNKPLFITGHSLGGALATVATKKLTHTGGIAACYTFGSPRVGDVVWTTNIKTPIYRLVNAADPVTMLPPGVEMIGAFAWLFGLIPHFGKTIKNFLLSKFNGYLHTGDMRYLTNCKAGGYSDVKLLYAVSWWFRIKAFLKKKTSFLKIPADHSITVYRNKLKVIANNMNDKTKNT